MTTTSIGDPLVGAVLDGRYRVQQRLARGGMATVYRATDTRLSRTVAVKVMHEGLGDDQDFARKFDREARSAARLSHPNVVSVFDQGHDGGRPFIVMEYVSGCTLRNVISAEAPTEPMRALELIDDILGALCAAHDNGLVHRDIKPENVLISTRGHVKVADFGLARAVTSQTATATQGVLIGTVSYLPPELVLHGKADTRSDIYSTGVVLFELLTGTKPYVGETPIQVAYAHVHNQIPPPSTRLPSSWQTSRTAIAPYVDAMVLAATQRDPDNRPTDARQMQGMVRAAMAALADGILDDPALTEEFSRCFAPAHSFAEPIEPGPEYVSGSGLPAHSLAPDPSAIPLAELLQPSAATAPGRTPSSPATAPTRTRRTSSATTRRTPGSARPTPMAVRRRRLAALVLATLLAVTGGTGWWLLDGRYMETPALAGLTQAAAQDTTQARGLTMRADAAYSETVPAGQVVSTDPAVGNDIRRGGTVTVVVSRGPERYAMPRIVGMKHDDAIRALTDNRLTPGTVKEDWDEELAPGLVSQASAEPGTQLRRDQRVDLTLSKGPRPIRVTDQTGRSAKDAEAYLEKLGLTVVVRTANSATVPDGQVISQNPASGVRKRGDTITLVRSAGPVLVAVPEVKARPIAEATAILTKAGFKVATKPAEGHLGRGVADHTDPAAGQQAPEGSTITIFLI